MEANFWVKVKAVKRGSFWHKGAVSLTIAKPATSANEVAIKINLQLPDALFDTPQLQASIIVPDNAVTKPVLDAEVQDNIADALSEQLGVNVNVTVDEE